MGFFESRIVEVSTSKIALWINARVDDWKAELAIIASYGVHSIFGILSEHVNSDTAERICINTKTEK